MLCRFLVLPGWNQKAHTQQLHEPFFQMEASVEKSRIKKTKHYLRNMLDNQIDQKFRLKDIVCSDSVGVRATTHCKV